MRLARCAAALLLTVLPLCAAKGEDVTSVEQAYRLLHKGNLSADAARSLRRFFEMRYKGQDLRRAAHRQLLQRTDDGGGYAAWCLRAPAEAKVTIVAEKRRRWPMTRLGDSDLWAWAEKFPNFSSVHYRFDVNGERLGGGRENRFGFESYTWLPDSLLQDGVPHGKLIDMGTHVSQKQFPGARRQWWVYVPAQYEQRKSPAKLIVFNDGGGFIKGEGNACTVLDNLIHAGKIPPMIAVFVNPGTFPANSRGGAPDPTAATNTTPARRATRLFWMRKSCRRCASVTSFPTTRGITPFAVARPGPVRLHGGLAS